jgi:ELWxxDGT repeat protein
MKQVRPVSLGSSAHRGTSLGHSPRMVAMLILSTACVFSLGPQGEAKARLPVANIVDFVTSTFFTSANSNPENITPLMIGAVQNVIFKATTGANGTELWRSDGTTAGTVLVKDIVSGAGSSNPANLKSGKSGVVNVVYFTATTATEGTEIWKTDGTTAGTVLIKDIVAGSGSSNPSNLTPGKSGGTDTCYFTATTTAEGTELWQSDGTLVGTFLVKDIVAGSGSSSPANLSSIVIGVPPVTTNSVIFSATTAAEGTELWRSDGTSVGTVLVKDIVSGAASSNPSNIKTGISGTVNVVYFTATTTAEGSEIYKSDGTTAGTVLIKDIVVGSGSSSPGNLTPHLIGGVNSCYFTATTTADGTELWRTDGTSAGTALVKNIVSGSGSSTPSNLVKLKIGAVDNILFTATTTAEGTEIWRSDGTSLGTVIVKDIVSGSGSSSPTSLKSGKSGGINVVYFAATTTAEGTEIYKTDGTTAGTVLILNIVSGSGSSSPINLTPTTAGGFDTCYFSATTTAEGRELWRSNGTAGTTILVKDIN